MTQGDWATDPQVIAAFTNWDASQRAMDALRPSSTPEDLAELDIQLRAAQARADTAWHVYETAREAAGGPPANPSGPAS
jgi:hypothetical protein